MKLRSIALFAAAAAFFSCQDRHGKLPDGLYAEIATAKGNIIVQLEYEKTPVTVANFVSLAEGKNPFVNPKYKGKPFYDGLKFHRVIQDFMIQGGDPEGTGSGDTGYKFKNEITDLKHDKEGTLSMANSGPDTNSSQFFITHVPTPWLDGMHTVFGHVVDGMETVNEIVQDDAIISVTIIRKGESAKKFDAVKTFSNYFSAESERQKRQAAAQSEGDGQRDAAKKAYMDKYRKIISAKTAEFDAAKNTGSETKTGLTYKIIKEGKGKRPEYGQTIYISYAGYFEDGTLFDTNIADVAKEYGKFNAARAAQKGYSPMPFEAGRKQGMIPGFIEGLEKMSFGDKAVVFVPAALGYGEAGSQGGIIPPDTNLVFELEITSAPK